MTKRAGGICVGLTDADDPSVIWTDGTGVAACGRTDKHGPHVETAKTQRAAECGCEIVGKRADGTPLPACGVVNFRYYGGKCAADARHVPVAE